MNRPDFTRGVVTVACSAPFFLVGAVFVLGPTLVHQGLGILLVAAGVVTVAAGVGGLLGRVVAGPGKARKDPGLPAHAFQRCEAEPGGAPVAGPDSGS